MSGGVYDYAYPTIEDLADKIKPTTTLRRAFKTHLRVVAEACRYIEWVDSDDSNPGDEDEAIQNCLEMNHEVMTTLAKLTAEQTVAALAAKNNGDPNAPRTPR